MRDEKIVELSEEELESLCACGCSCAKHLVQVWGLERLKVKNN